MLEHVGIGTQVEVVGVGVVLVEVFEVVVVCGGQVYTVVEIVAVGLDHPGGGLFDKQFDLLQLPPGHDWVQKEETELHQVENWKQLRLSGNPACRKQDAS
jgi:hypothetical protein